MKQKLESIYPYLFVFAVLTTIANSVSQHYRYYPAIFAWAFAAAWMTVVINLVWRLLLNRKG